MSNGKTEIIIEPLSNEISTEEDQSNWPSIIASLFNDIVISRSLILECIKAHQSIQPSPSTSIALISALRDLDVGNENDWTLNKQVMLDDASSIVPKGMDLSYRIIFEAIASMIVCKLLERTSHKKNTELMLLYGSDDDRFGMESMRWGRLVCDVTNLHVTRLVKDTLPYKIKRFPVSEFMAHIEFTYEVRQDLLDSEAEEFAPRFFYGSQDDLVDVVWPNLVAQSRSSFEKMYHNLVRFFIHPLEPGHFGTPLYKEPMALLLESNSEISAYHGSYLHAYYFRSDSSGLLTKNIYAWELLNEKSYPLLLRRCIKTLRHLITQKIPHFLGAKDVLFLVAVLGCLDDHTEHHRHNFPFAAACRSDEAVYSSPPMLHQPLSSAEKNELIAQLPNLLHTVIVKNEARNINDLPARELKRQQSQATKANIIIDHIHERIARSPRLFTTYCHYLLDCAFLEKSQYLFLQRYFEQAKESITKIHQQKRLFEIYKPIWTKKNRHLERTLWAFNGVTQPSHFLPIPSISTTLGALSQRFSSIKIKNINWNELGNGDFNIVFKSSDERLVFKTMYVSDPEDQKMDHYERSVRLWNDIHPTLSPPASLQSVVIQDELVEGWICPYIEGRQSTDQEMKIGLINLFNQTGRIVVDATAHKNFITTPSGDIRLVDVAYALALDKKPSLKRSVSHTSLAGWECFDTTLFKAHYDTYPKTIDTIKALLFIKLKKPEIDNVDFLKTLTEDSMRLLTDAYDDLILKTNPDLISEVSVMIVYWTIKQECVVALEQIERTPRNESAKKNHFFKNTMNSSVGIGYRALLQNIKQFTTTIIDVNRHIQNFVQQYGLNEIPSDIKKTVGEWSCEIAKVRPDIVDFQSAEQFLKRK